MRTHKEKFIYDMIKAEGVSKPTAKFFVELLTYFKISDPLISTSRKLGVLYECHERTIQRHIKELSEKFNYVYVKHTWNNDNPDRAYIESNTYSKTDLTLKLESRAEGFSQRDKNVNLLEGLF